MQDSNTTTKEGGEEGRSDKDGLKRTRDSDQNDNDSPGAKRPGVASGVVVPAAPSPSCMQDEGVAAGAKVEDGQDEGEGDASKLESKRAYNRRNAARARQRVKDQLSDLSKKVENFSHLNGNLEATNAQLRAQLKTAEEENKSMKQFIATKMGGASAIGEVLSPTPPASQGAAVASPLNPFIPALQSQLAQDPAGAQQAWAPTNSLSIPRQEQKEASPYAAPMVPPREQVQQSQGQENALALQLLLAGGGQGGAGYGGSQQQTFMSSALAALNSQMLMAGQGGQQQLLQQQQPLGLVSAMAPPQAPASVVPNTPALIAPQQGSAPDQQRALIMALLAQTQGMAPQGSN